MTVAAQERVQRDAIAAILGGERAVAERLPMFPVALERSAEAGVEQLREVSALSPRISLIAIGSGTVSQLIDAEPGAGIVELLHAAEWDSHLLLRIERDLVYAYLDMVLGGDGSQPAFDEIRPLSRMEMRVGRTLVARIGRALETGFASLAQSAFAVVDHQDRLDLGLLGGPAAPVAIARMRIDFADRGGDFLIAFPNILLTALRPALARAPSAETPRSDPRWSRQIQSEITRTRVVLRAVLDERMQTLGDISALKVGQVLELDATPRSRIRVECNGEALLWCEIGKSNGSYTLRVDDFIDQDQEFMHDLLTSG